MTEKIPFVGLHGHSTFSTFDALGYPQDHINFALQNGSEALALTDHGNMNGLSYQFLHSKKLKSEGKNFKPIYGVEAYFIDSISDWKLLKEKQKQEKTEKISEDDELGGIVLEDETSSKKKKNPLNKRSHLVILAQNQKGLNNLFSLISESFKQGNFYKFPRMDLDMLRRHNEGLIISSACLGGHLSTQYWENKDKGEQAIKDGMRDQILKFKAIFGERYFGELQWNNNIDQHIINQYIIELSKELNIQLISTADSHYHKPELWKDRLLYKNFRPGFNDSKVLPNSIDEVGYELFPKNGNQMMEAYEKYSSLCNIKYDSDLIKQSIERTHHIAFNMIENFTPNCDVKLPDFLFPHDFNENELFMEKCYKALKNKELDTNSVYKNRLEKELNVICRNGFAKYFLTMEKIVEKASAMCLQGGGRGSAAGCLVSYLLNITHIDPIKHDLLFERFMTSPKPSGFYIPGENKGGVKTVVNKLMKIELEDGREFYLTEDLVKGLNK